MTDVFELNEEEFKSCDMSELAAMVRNGLDIYGKMEEIGDWGHPNFYKAAIRYGTAELVNACIDRGASPNCTEPGDAEEGEGSLYDFTVGIALSAFNVETLRALLERGANPRYLYVGDPSWHLWWNYLPEAKHPETLPPAERESLAEIQEQMRKGAEIMKLLRDAGIRVPGMRADDDTRSLYSFWQGGGGWRSDLDDERRWDELEPEDFEDFDEDSKGCSETETNDGWGCRLPAPGSRSGALWHAASPEALKKMLDEGADVNMRDENGYTALHHLAYYGCSGYYLMPEVMMQILIDAGADIDDHNDYGACPLLFAAENIRPRPRSLELVKLLLRNGADYKAQTAGGADIVYWGSRYWYTTGSYENAMLQEGVEELVRSVAKDPETLEELGRTELSDADIDLMTAAFWAPAEELKPILDRGANINARTKHGYTPLMFASVYNYENAVRFLANRGREVPADLEAKNDREESPLFLAHKTHDQTVISALLDAGAVPLEKSPDEDKPRSMGERLARGLEYFGFAPSKTFEEVFDANGDAAVAAAVREGFPFSLEDDYDLNVFDAALRNGMTETIQACLDRGMDVNENWSPTQWIQIKTFPDSCPLYQAIDGYSVPAVKLLLEAGASTSIARNMVWRFRVNRLPEADDTDNEGFIDLKKESDAGAEILRLLHEKEPDIPCEWEGHELTYIYVGGNDYRADSVLSGDNLSGNELDEDDPEYEEPSVEPRELTALRLAMSPGAIDELIASGIDPNVRDSKGRTAIHWRVMSGKYYFHGTMLAIEALVRGGADINAKDNEGHTPLALALEMAFDDPSFEVVAKALVERGADINARDNEGNTPLSQALDMELEDDSMDGLAKTLSILGSRPWEDIDGDDVDDNDSDIDSDDIDVLE